MNAKKWEKWIGVGLVITMGMVVLGLFAMRILSSFDFWRLRVIGLYL
jgi:hypothetical protein